MKESSEQTNRPPTPGLEAEKMDVEGICLQGGVIAAAATQYERMKAAFAAANAAFPDEMPRHVPQTFNDFLNARIVDGLILTAPRILECLKLTGQAESDVPSAGLLLSAMAAEIRQMACGLRMLTHRAGSFERTALDTLIDAATTLSACADGIHERKDIKR